MDETSKAQTREQRLAASLRENLKRRKSQARALAGQDAPVLPKADTKNV